MRRYEIRNEYGAGEVDLYKSVDKDDPEILLEGIAMAGLVGVLRQLGDLAEFAAEIFHDLHEDVMATAARGHDLMARVHQLEAEVPFVEKSFVTESHRPCLSNPGVGWHASINIEHNTITQGNLPRFVMDSCEECRGPPRLFLLDKFDVAGAGACLKRYTDPAFFKAQAEAAQIANVDQKSRKIKKRTSRWRRGDNPESVISSNTTLHDLLSKDFVKIVHSTPTRLLKIKRKFSNGFLVDGTNYIEKFRETILQENSFADSDPEFSNLNSYGSGLDIHEINVVNPLHGKELVVSSFDVNHGESENEVSARNTDRAIVKFAESMSELDTDESVKIGMPSEDTNSEMGIYLDALASVDSENEPNTEPTLLLHESTRSVANTSANYSDSRSFGHSSVSYEWDNLPTKGRNSFDDILSNTSHLRLRESRTLDGDEFSSSSSQIDAQLSMASGGPEVYPPISSCSSELVRQVVCFTESERVVNDNVKDSRSSQHFACLNESSSGFLETNVSAAFHDFPKESDATVVSNSKKIVDLESESNATVSHSLISFPIVTSIQEGKASSNFGNGFLCSDIHEDLSTFVASNEKVKEDDTNGVAATSDIREDFRYVPSNDEKDGISPNDKASVPFSEIRHLVASDEKVGENAGGVVISDTLDDLPSRVASHDATAGSVPCSDILEDLHSFVPSIGSDQNHKTARSHNNQKIIADEMKKENDSLDEDSLFRISDVARNKTKASSSLEWKEIEATERFVDFGGNLTSLHDVKGMQSESIGGSLPPSKYEIFESENVERAEINRFSIDMASFPTIGVPVASSLGEDLPPLPPLPPIQWRTGKLPLFMPPSVYFDRMDESVPASDSAHKNINHICLDADDILVSEKEDTCDSDGEQKRLNFSPEEHSNLVDFKLSLRDLSLGAPDLNIPLYESGREVSTDLDGDEHRLITNHLSSDDNSNLTIIESSPNSKVRASESGKEIVCGYDSEEQKMNSDVCPPPEDSLHGDIKSSSGDINLETPNVKFPPFDSEKETSYDSVGEQKAFHSNHFMPDDHPNIMESKSLQTDLKSETPDPNSKSEQESFSQEKLNASLPVNHSFSTLPTPHSSELIIRHSSGNESLQEDPSSNEIPQKEKSSNLRIPHVEANPTDMKSVENDLTSDVEEGKANYQEVLPSRSERSQWSTNTLSLPPTFGVGKLHKNRQSLPRNPLIDAAAAVDKSKLRKVIKHDKLHLPPSLPERDTLRLKKISGKSVPKIEQRDSLLEQIRTKSFNLKPPSMARSTIQNVPAPKTNLKVAAILEKANAIRQALAGSDESDDSEDWADS